MAKKIISTTLILIMYTFICTKIYQHYNRTPFIQKQSTIKTKNKIETITENKVINEQLQTTTISQIETPIGILNIPKIKLSKKIYSLNSKLNTIDKNISILAYSKEPSNDNSIIFIAAHSGTGKLAYFKDLHKLDINDTINLTYKNVLYTYKIKDIWEIKKQGNISVEKEPINQLVLTTCSPTNKDNQLIINSILIQKES